jgi:hypothetical protein
MSPAPDRQVRGAGALGLPYPPYLWLVVRQSMVIWLLVRVLILLLLAAATDVSIALHPGFTTRAFLVVVTALLVWWDRRRSHELILHAELGASPGWFWAASLLTACAMDLAIQALIH